ncbi:glycosyl hydrolase family 76 [Pedobacter sp. KBW06]|uniref:glycoside hydrolase family 76 protein n=1 Tax=Pedobacter sp. KBW06 TaxID=2153359 RepID=UPI000F5B4461|nr:glycoside hydrolase family 76 protein [Pedobacter sp. KBW06]RQO74756.1 glycosyl hydrolase family 76 [Pedobacter sp. KBW06]
MRRLTQLIMVAGTFAGSMSLNSCEKDVFPLYNEEIVVTNYNYSGLADSLQKQLYSTYLSSNENYLIQDNQGNTTFHYWPNAHVLDIFADGFLRTKDQVYVTKMKALLNGIKLQNGNVFPNDFYDDMGWLALSALRAYDATKDETYVQATDILWTDMKKGITDVQGGGMGWSKGKPNFKNTPANGPAIILAARLYRLQNKAEDLQTAKTLYTWLKSTLVEPVTFTVWDGINYDGTGVISKNKYTYNVGLFIGAGLELYKTTKEKTYLDDAVKTAIAGINDVELAPGGLMKDEGQGDGGLFKGVWVRYLSLLVNEPDVPAAEKEKLIKFLKYNAQTLYKQGISRPGLMISPAWNKAPQSKTDLTTQLSGMMLIETAAQFSAAGILK